MYLCLGPRVEIKWHPTTYQSETRPNIDRWTWSAVSVILISTTFPLQPLILIQWQATGVELSLYETQQRLFMKYVCDVEVSAHKSQRAPLSSTHFITEIKSVSMAKLTATKHRLRSVEVVHLNSANKYYHLISWRTAFSLWVVFEHNLCVPVQNWLMCS